MLRWMGSLLAVAGLLSMLIGVILVAAGLKGIAFTGEWVAHECMLHSLQQRMQLRHDPLVMPRGGQALLNTVVQLRWNDTHGHPRNGTWTGLGNGVNFDKLGNLRQRLEVWSNLITTEERYVSVWLGGQRWPSIDMVEEWYQSLPFCDGGGVAAGEGLRCGTSAAYLLPLDSAAGFPEVWVQSSSSLFAHVKLHITNATVACYTHHRCSGDACAVLLTDPIRAKVQAEHAILSGLVLILAVICFSTTLQKAARHHLAAFQASARSFCSTVVWFTDNPEESTPLLRHRA